MVHGSIVWILYSRHYHSWGTVLLELDVRAAKDWFLELDGQIYNGRRYIAVLDNTAHECTELVTKFALHEVCNLLICRTTLLDLKDFAQ